METGETQWKEDIKNGYREYPLTMCYWTEEDWIRFITQTLKSLGRELEEKKMFREKTYQWSAGEVVSMEDIYSVLKRYGVDIGGKGE